MKRRRKNRPIQTPPLLRLTDFSVHRETPLLEDISWTIRPRERWVILGANGSGKSTLVNALAGYVMFNGGTLRVLNQTYGRADWRNVRAHIGLVSAHIEHRIDGDETAADIVASGPGALLNTGRAPTAELRKEALTHLKSVGCGPMADRIWGVLSQGERQRLLIARALMSKPALLILDEPCAGLDPVARAHFLDFLGVWGRRPSAPGLIFVTHHVEEIISLFTHVLLLRAGRVAAQGPVKDTLTSAELTKAFDAPLEIARENGGYRIKTARRLSASIKL